MVVRVTSQGVHGIKAVLGKHIVEARNAVLLADSLDRIINGQRGSDARLVAVGAEEIIAVWTNIKDVKNMHRERKPQEYSTGLNVLKCA